MEYIFEKLENKQLENLQAQAAAIAEEFCDTVQLKPGQIVAVGCSTSEILGKKFGTFSHPDAGEAVFEGIYTVLKNKGIYLAAQCCEHLNRAIVTEAAAVPNAEYVNVIPQPKAGGSFATAAYRHFSAPVVLEEIHADAGFDIGGTLIGMHLKKVAVPMKLTHDRIGEATVHFARTRPKFIGGVRAVYDQNQL
ncbi:MAG: TIGR01440 family protein [Clostridia bacterium]|nr:TIGR01440 family protein [Clostridia bacterium]